MKRLVSAFVGLVCLANVAHAEITAPDTLIDTTVQLVISTIKEDKEIQAGDTDKIGVLIDSKILPHFDFTRMTQLAMGKNWRTASDKQKEILIAEFRNMMVRTYTKAFTMYQDQKIEVTPVNVGSEDRILVKTMVKESGKPDIPVDYRMIKTDTGWKAYDVSIEGISMVTSYRSTFDSEIKRNGIDGLIKLLASKNASNDAAEIAAKSKG